MAKSAFSKKFTLNATGILSIDDEVVALENTDTGELVPLSELMEDFADRMVKLSLNYEEDYSTYQEDYDP